MNKKYLILSTLLLWATFPSVAEAGQAEARELARNYNCQVASITPVSLETGQQEAAIYKVGCALSATASDDEKKANGTLMIRCEGSLCQLLKQGE